MTVDSLLARSPVVGLTVDSYKYQLPITNYQLPIPNSQFPLPTLLVLQQNCSPK
ncbi:MAG: hypothetical protein HC849_20690 [Oscillatoriales cyanobacterium RU_3_3]|nr:hypothetical protein [Microcoleus sp. SU_5_6]NJL66245.1 hypothetical protein [Microcoleus sp. SM1_3_4]NJM62074.1 hypothetical protein [Oscillatoriales cyanobacterium RU_3_3]